jgi:asparagine synthase (glutamine-hydrolysing)
MFMAHSVEGRYPFLDRDLVEFVRLLPTELKLNGLVEKFILKRIAANRVPREILRREKFGFHAPGAAALLRQNVEWINDTLSCERLAREGYFNVAFIEELKRRYREPDFRLDPRLESDVLLIVLSFNVFTELFGM